MEAQHAQSEPAPDVGPAYRYGKVWKYDRMAEAMESGELNVAELAVFNYLVHCRNSTTGESFPAISTVAAKLRISDKTVKRALASLESKGFISRRKRPSKDGRFAQNAYGFPVRRRGVILSITVGSSCPVPGDISTPLTEGKITTGIKQDDLSVTHYAAGTGPVQDSRHEESIQTTDSGAHGQSESALKRTGNPASTSRPRESETDKRKNLEELAAVILSTLPGKKIQLNLLRDEVEKLVAPGCNTYAEVLHQAEAYRGYLKRTGEEPAWRTRFFIIGWHERNWRSHADSVLRGRQETEAMRREVETQEREHWREKLERQEERRRQDEEWARIWPIAYPELSKQYSSYFAFVDAKFDGQWHKALAAGYHHDGFRDPKGATETVTPATPDFECQEHDAALAEPSEWHDEDNHDSSFDEVANG